MYNTSKYLYRSYDGTPSPSMLNYSYVPSLLYLRSLLYLVSYIRMPTWSFNAYYAYAPSLLFPPISYSYLVSLCLLNNIKCLCKVYLACLDYTYVYLVASYPIPIWFLIYIKTYIHKYVAIVSYMDAVSYSYTLLGRL